MMYSLDYAHPSVSMLYFLSVMLITMFTKNPIFLILAFMGGICFLATKEKKTVLKRSIVFYILIFVLVSLTNPLFSHNGETSLFFINNNPVTLEAFIYGMNLGVMLIAVICWFGCFNKVMTTDKLLFLFGRISPKLSLLVSAALRFIPLFKQQAGKIRQAGIAMGLYTTESWFDRLRATMRVYSSLVTWSLENAIDTGASMKARGYGLKGRSRFSVFKFSRKDFFMLVFVSVADIVVVTIMVTGALNFEFYPKLTEIKTGCLQLVAYVIFGIISFMPIILEFKESIQWKYYRSKI